MGERKGVNKWYPPDYDPTKGGLNKWQGTHALRERAKKIHLGILIIRFEMPYNIWCEGCGIHIGMGVRYNSEKRKVGMYYTTPIYQFRMKCHLCPNHIEIKTDPGNLDYVIVSGARRQEKRFEATENGTVVPDEKATINKLSEDAMFKLEHGEKDSSKGKDEKPRIGKMLQIQDRVKDDYMANRILRDQMRGPRKKAKEQSIKDQALLKKASLSSSMKLLPETETDGKMASLLRLKSSSTSEEKEAKLRENITEESIFTAQNTPRPGTSKQKALSDMEKIVQRKKENDIDSSLVPKSSKCIGVVLKKPIVSKSSTVTSQKSNGISESSKPPIHPTEEKSNFIIPEEILSPTKPAEKSILSLISCDYGSSSSNDDEEDN